MGQRYQDMMDESRVVEPNFGSNGLADGTSVQCRIYFNGRFAGKAPIPRALFLVGDEDPKRDQKCRIGFAPMN
jgi:hypothetical protein